MNPEMLERLVRVPMPYGKYKGRLIADLPGNYLNWFAREGFPNRSQRTQRFAGAHSQGCRAAAKSTGIGRREGRLQTAR